MARRKKKDFKNFLIIFLLILVIVCAIYVINENKESVAINTSNILVNTTTSATSTTTTETILSDNIPNYEGQSVIELNGNKPNFNDDEYTTESYEYYSDLDSLGRAGTAKSNIGQDLMPTEDRTSISSVKPTGWQTIKYDNVPGKYLYNRCHLIGFQLTGENANEKNLITCTRSMNTIDMLKYEDMVTDYIKETNNHVLYRVTPVYDGDNLLAKGVIMEASSVEDKCGSICYNIFIYNVQPGITIDYQTGESKLES